MKPCKEAINGYKCKDGYYRFKNGKVGGEDLVHRWVYKTKVGPLEKHEVVRHTCDNPSCVEETHLIKGSQQDNIQDRVDRMRCAIGPKNGNLKLTEDDIRDIFRMRGYGCTLQEIANKHDISNGYVSEILHRKYWKHVL